MESSEPPVWSWDPEGGGMESFIDPLPHFYFCHSTQHIIFLHQSPPLFLRMSPQQFNASFPFRAPPVSISPPSWDNIGLWGLNPKYKTCSILFIVTHIVTRLHLQSLFLFQFIHFLAICNWLSFFDENAMSHVTLYGSHDMELPVYAMVISGNLHFLNKWYTHMNG